MTIIEKASSIYAKLQDPSGRSSGQYLDKRQSLREKRDVKYDAKFNDVLKEQLAKTKRPN